ncbi:thiamine pyrophosphate-binding protein [Nocardia suismassiliense]|uniref:thiamine pyrophosphate-binding protein n=1 Tax=Nocardia suismassiliense TaxID=2077092 RepID=UPI000D1E94DF|nr:thiamine pyrophosphate-dependent enzyme [Nocardia suismassiliense]
MTTRMSCAEATLRTMADLGCEKFFNIPGRGIYPLLSRLPAVPELDYVTGLHEFPLAAIADGYVRASGSPAFVNLYMSTGTLNAASSIFLSQRDRIPMVVTATQAESWAVGADHRAEISDIVAAMRPITKWAWQPPSPERVPEALVRAYTIATTPPMGPTFVSIPVDFWDAEIEYTPPRRTVALAPGGDAAADGLQPLVEAVIAAQAPCFVVGFEGIAAGIAPTVQRLAAHLGAALVAEPEPGRLPAGTRFPQFAGSVAEACEVIEHADVIVHIGTNSYEAFHREIFAAGGAKTQLWIGTDGRELNKIIQCDLAVIAPIAPVIEAMAQRIFDTATGDFAVRDRVLRDRIAAERDPIHTTQRQAWDDEPLGVARVCAELRAALPPETVLLDHSTTAVRLVREYFPVPQGEQYISASGSCQGWGLGAAIGVQLADLDRPVVGIVGDGGFMFGVQALWTAVQYELPILIVVLDNGGWSSMRTSLARTAPQVVEAGMDLHYGWTGDYAALASSLGAASETIESVAALRKVLARSLPLRAPLVLDVRVRREKKTSASPFVGY